MKTAVSIPDEVFEKAERLARRARLSRSAIFSAALKEYVARHAPDDVTEAMNRVCDEVGDRPESFVAAAGRPVLENTECDLPARSGGPTSRRLRGSGPGFRRPAWRSPAAGRRQSSGRQVQRLVGETAVQDVFKTFRL